MSWRAGCHEQPPVADGATRVTFDFAAADALGAALARAKQEVGANVDARGGQVGGLADWTGRFRDDFNTTKATNESSLTGAVETIDAGLRSLRTAWDAACEGQTTFNRQASESEPPN